MKTSQVENFIIFHSDSPTASKTCKKYENQPKFELQKSILDRQKGPENGFSTVIFSKTLTEIKKPSLT